MKKFEVKIQLTKIQILKSKYTIAVLDFKAYIKNENSLLKNANALYKQIKSYANEYNQTIKNITNLSEQKPANKFAVQVLKEIKKENDFLLKVLPSIYPEGEKIEEDFAKLENSQFSKQLDLDNVKLADVEKYLKNPELVQSSLYNTNQQSSNI